MLTDKNILGHVARQSIAGATIILLLCQCNHVSVTRLKIVQP